MDTAAHHTRQTRTGTQVTCWQLLPGLSLEAHWHPPLQLETVRLLPTTDNIRPGSDNCDAPTAANMTLLLWLSCEKASGELALDDPLQAELAMAIMTLKAESLRMAGFLDARPAEGANVTPLQAPAYSMK